MAKTMGKKRSEVDILSERKDKVECEREREKCVPNSQKWKISVMRLKKRKVAAGKVDKPFDEQWVFFLLSFCVCVW